MPLRKYQSVKAIADKSAMTKVKGSEYGAPCEEQLFELLTYWEALFAAHPDIGSLNPEYLENYGGQYWLYKENFPNPVHIKTQTVLLIAKLRQAMQTGNGDFFRNLGDAIERYKKVPIDKLRCWLSTRFFPELSQDGTVAKGFEQVEIPREKVTLRQLHEEARKEGIRVDERQLRRACKELGIELAKSPRGRPKGKKGKSRDPK